MDVGNISPKFRSMIYWIILQALVKQFEQLFVWSVYATRPATKTWMQDIDRIPSCFHRFVSRSTNINNNIIANNNTNWTLEQRQWQQQVQKHQQICVANEWPLKYKILSIRSWNAPVFQVDICTLTFRAGERKEKKKIVGFQFSQHIMMLLHRLRVFCWWAKATSFALTLIYAFDRHT